MNHVYSLAEQGGLNWLLVSRAGHRDVDALLRDMRERVQRATATEVYEVVAPGPEDGLDETSWLEFVWLKRRASVTTVAVATAYREWHRAMERERQYTTKYVVVGPGRGTLVLAYFHKGRVDDLFSLLCCAVCRARLFCAPLVLPPAEYGHRDSLM